MSPCHQKLKLREIGLHNEEHLYKEGKWRKKKINEKEKEG